MGNVTINWGKIHLLEGRLLWWRGKISYRRRELGKWRITGDRAHYWQDKHIKEGNTKAAAVNQKQIEECRKEIGKWADLVNEAEHEIHALERVIRELKPKIQAWPMGGLVRPGEAYRWQRSDQGQDFEIPLYHSIVAPGHGYCVEYAHDQPFPNGFGDPYVILKFSDGPFSIWPAAYAGHANEPIIRPGEHFVPGQPLARLNHSLNAGWGWIEFGRWDGGPGPMGEGEKWRNLFKTIYR